MNGLIVIVIILVIFWVIKKLQETGRGNHNHTGESEIRNSSRGNHEGSETEKGYLSRGFEEVVELTTERKEPAKYSENYERRDMIMSIRERALYDQLKQMAVGDFDIYPQVHVDKILQPRRGLFGKSRLWALRGINQKSVDFLIVDSKWQSPVLAIELDDGTHEKEDRIDRDWFIECAFKNAGVPLLRLAARTNYNASDLEAVRRFLTRQNN